MRAGEGFDVVSLYHQVWLFRVSSGWAAIANKADGHPVDLWPGAHRRRAAGAPQPFIRRFITGPWCNAPNLVEFVSTNGFGILQVIGEDVQPSKILREYIQDHIADIQGGPPRLLSSDRFGFMVDGGIGYGLLYLSGRRSVY
jgi:hypothetical protein